MAKRRTTTETVEETNTQTTDTTTIDQNSQEEETAQTKDTEESKDETKMESGEEKENKEEMADKETVSDTQKTVTEPKEEPKVQTIKFSTSDEMDATTGEETNDSTLLEILANFPFEETLYIDKHRGTFKANTPKQIRGCAKLYKNPYFKK